ALGEIQRVQPQLVGFGIDQGQACIVVVDHAAQAGGSGGEESAKVEVRYQGVVDFEQQAQPVALASQLLLVGPGVLVVERVVHGDRHLPDDEQQELDIGLAVSSKLRAPYPHRAEP